LGDVVHALPFLNALKGRFPDSEIHWVIARGFHELLEDHPMIEKLWIIDKDQWKKPSRLKDTLSSLHHLSMRLREERFDLVVDLQGLFRSGIISRSSGCGLRIGFEEAREGSRFFYTHRVRGGKEIHAVDRYLKVAAFLECDTSGLRFPLPPPPVSFADSPLLWALPENYAVIAPSAGSLVKRWPAERFGQLAARLPFLSVVVTGKADASQAEKVVQAARGRAVSLAGRTSLKELVAIIKGAKCLICSDTGPMHIAAALGVPVFAVFGPTNPLRTGPYGSIHTVVRADLPCSPCYRRKACRDWKCMEAISVDEVYRTIREKMIPDA
jgi:lipopolysaccharide heptosyltransferase I